MTSTPGSGGGGFKAGRTYEHAYLVFVDASGHSNVVRSNPRDRASQAFDMLESKVHDRFQRVARSHRCKYARSWGWQGDGGLYIVWDTEDSNASATALDASRSLITLDLVHLRDEFEALGIRGELHLRVGVHRGTLTYLGADREGAIHSPDLNFAAHLEKACPRDCVAISRAVYDVMPAHQSDFHRVGVFEDHEVFLYAPDTTERGARARWLATRGLPDFAPVPAFHERPSPQSKAELVSVAEGDVIELGTGLRAGSHYLTTTARPRPYRDAVVALLERGGTYRGFMLWGTDEDPPVNPFNPDDDLWARAQESLRRLEEFRDSLPAGLAERFEVHGMPLYPGMAALSVDTRSARDCIVLYSPYLPGLHRGDTPHYVVTAGNGRLFELIRDRILAITTAPDVHRLL